MPNYQTKAALCAVGLMGILGTWGRAIADGSMELQMQAVQSPIHILPGTQSALRRTITGIRYPVDFALNLLIVFWFEALDGSHPAASAVSLYFLGQLFPCALIVYLDSLRGNRPSLLKPTLWIVICQCCSIGVVGSFVALAYIVASPTVNPGLHIRALRHASVITSPVFIWLLLPATILGYFLTALLMCLPSFPLMGSPPLVSSGFQQIAMAVWNMFPLVIWASIYLLRLLLKSITPTTPSRPADNKANNSSSTTHLRALRAITIPSLIISSVFHLSILGTSLATVVFPVLFQPRYLEELRPSSLFLPPLSINPQSITPGDGLRSFLLWDQAATYLLVIVVTVLELQTALASAVDATGGRATTAKTPYIIWLAVFGVSLVFGPGTACLAVSWTRDEVLFGGWSLSGNNVKREVQKDQ
ncbi:hypothetical protein BDV12DRAFT_211221 [Aspergillus spectabilis]